MGSASDARTLRQLFARLVHQEFYDVHYAFPAIVEKYLEPHPDSYGKGQTRGVLKARAIVRPKYRKFMHGGKHVVLKELWNVPVSWYRLHDFEFRFPLRKGDVVMCIVSERALDHLLEDHKPRHPQIKEMGRIEDAVVLPFGMRTDDDPLTPDEALDCLYFANVDEDGSPVSKFIMQPDGKVKIIAPEIDLIGKVNLADYGGPGAARIGDHDDDDEGSGADAIVEGSEGCFIADKSGYKAGITEPEFILKEESTTEEQPQPPAEENPPHTSENEDGATAPPTTGGENAPS